MNKYIYVSNIKIDCYNYLLPKLSLINNKIYDLIDFCENEIIYLNPCIDEIKFKNIFNKLLIETNQNLYELIYNNINELFKCMVLFDETEFINLDNDKNVNVNQFENINLDNDKNVNLNQFENINIKADDIYKFMKSNPNITKSIERYIRYQDNLTNVDNNDWNINILIYNSGNIEFYDTILKCMTHDEFNGMKFYNYLSKNEMFDKIKGGIHLICMRKDINIDLNVLRDYLINFKSWFKTIIPASGCRDISANKTIFYYYLYINNYFNNLMIYI